MANDRNQRLRCAAGMAVFLSAGGTWAADIYNGAKGGSLKDADQGVYAPYSWAGWYGGFNGGGAVGGSSTLDLTRNGKRYRDTSAFDPSGGFGGGQIGYNFTYGNFVYGLETDIQGGGVSDKKTRSPFGAPLAAEVSNDWFGTVRGRIGYSFDKWLVFATGGLAWGNVNEKIGTLKTDETRAGVTVGGGVEYAFSQNWSAKVEYLAVGLGFNDNPSALDATGAKVTSKDFDGVGFSAVRLGINYHFDRPYEGLK